MKKLRARLSQIATAVMLVVLVAACGGVDNDTPRTEGQQYTAPAWSDDIVMYELNVRQFSDEGTFSAVEERVDELAALGVDVIWFMPVHPIGELKRKGPLGSYYSVRDFRDVNSEFGDINDFRSLVNSIHEAGMYVMMDWVPNHSSWDNRLADEHPDWYVRDSTGSFVSPYDWTDVIQFDWSNEGLHKYMKEALLYWVEELDVDGFRVDHPHVTPAEFWLDARLAMEKIKPVLMLAENEERVEFFENGFDMNYSWELHHLMNRVAQGEETAQELHRAMKEDLDRYPDHAYRLRFITNHDENSWAGTIEERMGEAHEAFAVFMYTIPGVPLIYNGQEAGLNKRLDFFDRDPIEWHDSYLRDFYTSLNSLKEDNEALHNGTSGGSFRALNISGDQEVYGYIREKDDNIVITVINFDDDAAEFTVNTNVTAEYKDYFSGETINIGNNHTLLLEGWSYLVLTAL